MKLTPTRPTDAKGSPIRAKAQLSEKLVTNKLTKLNKLPSKPKKLRAKTEDGKVIHSSGRQSILLQGRSSLSKLTGDRNIYLTEQRKPSCEDNTDVFTDTPGIIVSNSIDSPLISYTSFGFSFCQFSDFSSHVV